MIWLKLSVLALFASWCDSVSDKRPDSNLLYAVEREDSIFVYLTDLNLQNPREVFQLQNTSVDKMYLSKHVHGMVIYWNQKDSSVIWRYEVSAQKMSNRSLSNENAIFIGLDDNDAILLYLPSSRVIKVYEYDSEKYLKTLGGLGGTNSDMKCFDVEPGDREVFIFADCNGGTRSYKYYYMVDEEVYHFYHRNSLCFDTWSIMPNGKGAYAVKGKDVYKAPDANAFHQNKYLAYFPHKENITIDENIVGFVAGNYEFYYGNVGKDQKSKIFKATQQGDGYNKSDIEVDGTIKLLDLYIQPKRYNVFYAAVKGNTLEFAKTDFGYLRTKSLVTINTTGQVFHKMQLGNSDDGKFLYWSYKNSNNLGRFKIRTGEQEQRELGQKLGTFIGVGNNDNLYFYNPVKKTFTVYNFKNNLQEFQFFISQEADMRCVDINPLNREQIFFAECTNGQSFLNVLDVSQKNVLMNYRRILFETHCFHVCAVSQNGETIHAVFGQDFFVSSATGGSFEKKSFPWYMFMQNAETLVVGNKELFFTTIEADGQKIYKSGEGFKRFIKNYIQVDGNVRALALYHDYEDW